MQKILFSIIIPHKNTPQLLKRCLNSIPKREDAEVIIVDNNSSSSNLRFIEDLGGKRQNIIIIKDPVSKGAGGARNTGLKAASGKWILFVDSDDFFNYCICDIFNDYAGVNDKDVVFFKVNSIYSDTYVNYKRGCSLNEAIDRFDENVSKNEQELRFSFFSPWGKLIRSNLIKSQNLQFEDSIIMNDNYFSYHLCHAAQDISIDKRALCCITENKNSVSKNTSLEALLECIRIKTEAEVFYRKNNIPVRYLRNANYHYYWKLLIKYRNHWRKGYNIFVSYKFPTYRIIYRMAICEISIFYGSVKRSVRRIIVL